MSDIEQGEFAGVGAYPGPLGPLAAVQTAPLGGLQTIGGGGLAGGPPVTVGVLSPEPVPPPPTDDQLLEALTVSYQAYERLQARMPNYHPDALIRGKGYDVLDTMKNHGAYNSPLRLKKYSILYKESQTLPRVNGQVVKDDHPRYDRACEIADFCRYAIHNILDPVSMERTDFRTVLWYQLDACHCGNSTQEVVWRIATSGEYKGKRLFSRFVPRSPKQITYNLDPFTNSVVSLNNYTSLGWQSYLPVFRKFFRYTYQPEKGLPWGRGDARACYKHIFGLDELVRLWGVALQKHGGGFLKGTTQNPNADHVAAFVAMLDLAQSTSSIVVTGDKQVELLNLPGGALDAFVHPIKFNEEMIAREVLGQTLTTGDGGGKSSYALGGVHADTEEYFRAFPRRDLEEAVQNQIYFWLVYTNYGEEDLDCVPAHSQGVWNWQEQGMIAKFIETFTNMGYMRPSYDDDWARKLVGMPFLPTTNELDSDHPAILPDKERVIIQMPNGDQYNASKVQPDKVTATSKASLAAAE